MTQRDSAPALALFEKAAMDRNSELDAAIEQDLYLHFDAFPAQPQSQSFLQGLVARLDWYRTGSVSLPFMTCTDPGAAASISAATKTLTPTYSAGGNIAVQSDPPQPGLAALHITSSGDADVRASRKRSLDSSASEGDEVWLHSPSQRRRRLA